MKIRFFLFKLLSFGYTVLQSRDLVSEYIKYLVFVYRYMQTFFFFDLAVHDIEVLNDGQ